MAGITREIPSIIVDTTQTPHGMEATLTGSVQSMNASFRSFAIGLTLSILLLYLILVAQFRSFLDPFIILLALPPGITGVLVALLLWGTTLNVMSLMGVVMLAGIALSNSILIVEFAHHLLKEGMAVREAIVTSCRVRLRPILMTSRLQQSLACCPWRSRWEKAVSLMLRWHKR